MIQQIQVKKNFVMKKKRFKNYLNWSNKRQELKIKKRTPKNFEKWEKCLTLKQYDVSSPSHIVCGSGNFRRTRYLPTAPNGRPRSFSASM